jgi:hypothetical protein
MLAPVAFDWIEFLVVNDGTCRVRREGGGDPCWAGPGSFVFLMPNTPCAVEPDGQVAVTRLFVSVAFMLQVVSWRNPALRLDALTAATFARQEYPEPTQVARAHQDGMEGLFACLDRLGELTDGRQIAAHPY